MRSSSCWVTHLQGIRVHRTGSRRSFSNPTSKELLGVGLEGGQRFIYLMIMKRHNNITDLEAERLIGTKSLEDAVQLSSIRRQQEEFPPKPF